ncbi:MAG TPA: carboxymuconolactone decarboxylase family protein [Kofleriaceae bacterium]|nr:carboxymuconolactone decarboxylase family protein [Kofleriaceae bacterium]
MLDALKDRVPEHAKDLRLNLGVIEASTALSPAQAWTIAVACARASRQPEVIRAIEEAAGLTAEALAAARGAAAMMGMNNVYYRFAHYMGDGDYAKLPARLRMQLIGKPGIPQLDFELACLAVSAQNGCEACVRSHEHAVRERGGSPEIVQDAVRIAAVISGVAAAL